MLNVIIRTAMAGALLVSCTAAVAGGSDVVQTGPDTYILANHGVKGWSSGSTQKVKAIERASEYCKKLGKQMQIVNVTENAGGWAKQASADVEFRCVVPTTDGPPPSL
jgi:hypothetical protein